jgi:hypothetical protein
MERMVKAGMRRAVASFAGVAFLVFWIWLALAVADRLPQIMWLKIVFFAIVGTGWGLPLLPLISWANRPDRSPPP